jgi:hypothetical protein
MTSHADANLRGESLELPHENGSSVGTFSSAESFPPRTRMEVVGDKPGQEDVTIHEGLWGEWKGWDGTLTGGYYACGAEMRSEDWADYQDDTAGNGLKFTYCHLDNWNAQKTEIIYPGLWGDWKGMRFCPEGSYVDGAQVRFEGSTGGGKNEDDTALNGLKIRCRNYITDIEEWVMVYEGYWGYWRKQTFITDKYVTLANIRFEDSIGDGDDTAWNGLAFRYEFPNNGTSLEPIKGYWRNLASANSVSMSITESMETTEGESLSEEQSHSVTNSMSVGYSFLGAETEYDISGTNAQSTTNMVSSTISLTQEVTLNVACPTLSSETGFWFLYQWVMDQAADPIGSGFKLASSHFLCVPSIEKAPKCPLGMCTDSKCQTCTGPLALSDNDDKVEVA